MSASAPVEVEFEGGKVWQFLEWRNDRPQRAIAYSIGDSGMNESWAETR
jgi:hypothetical protein